MIVVAESLRRNGRRRDLFKIIQRCFREFGKKQGLRVSCAGIARSDSEHSSATNTASLVWV